MPYEWSPQDFGGNPNGTAVYYNGCLFQKYVQMGTVIGHPHIIKYISYISVVPTYSDHAWATVPAIYYNANFNTIYEWSASNGAVLNSYPTVYSTAKGYPSDLQYPSTSGGLIAADPNTGYALGVYMPLIPFGGTLLNFSWWQFNNGTGTSPTSDACYAIYPTYAWSFTGGAWSNYNTYIVVGASVADVAADMLYLQQNGYK